MNKEEIKYFLREKKGYVKFGAYKLSTILDCNENLCYQALNEVRKELKNKPGKGNKTFKIKLDKDFKTSQDVFKDAFTNGFLAVDSFKTDVKKSKSGITHCSKLKSLGNIFCRNLAFALSYSHIASFLLSNNCLFP